MGCAGILLRHSLNDKRGSRAENRQEQHGNPGPVVCGRVGVSNKRDRIRLKTPVKPSWNTPAESVDFVARDRDLRQEQSTA
jgi:hypothetical protein